MIFRLQIDKYGIIFWIKYHVMLNSMSFNQYGLAVLVNNEQFNQESLFK
jgi:hypothetical protein